MTTVDELRDILFYMLRKLDDFLVDLTTEIPQPQQPQPQPQPPTRMISDEEMDRRLEAVRRMLYPNPIQDEINDTRRMLQESIKQDEEEIKDLQKRINEKTTILNYLLSKLIKLRELQTDENIITHLEYEFETLRLERERLEKRIIELKEHIRFIQN